MLLKAVFSGSWVSDPSKKEDPLKKRRLAQLPGCKPDPTNWRWFKKIAAWGRLRVKNVNGKTFGKKVVLFMLELAPFCDLVLVRDLVFLYLQDLHPPKKSFGKGIWLYYTFRICIPQKNLLVREFGFTIPSGFASPKNPLVRDLVFLYLQDLHPQKNPLVREFGFPIPSGFASPKKSIGEGIWFYYTLRICIPKKSIGKMERG